MDFKLISDACIWDSLVNKKYGRYKQYYRWNILEAQYLEMKFIPLGIYENNIIVDIFPLLINEDTKNSFSHGCLQPQYLTKCIEHVRSAYTIRSIKVYSNVKQAGIIKSVESVNYEMVADISGIDSLDGLLSELRFVRKNYQKATKNNVTVMAENDTNNFYTFYTAMVKRNRAKIIFPKSWFDAILSNLSDKAQIKTAFYNNRAIGSIFYLKTKHSIFDYFPAIDFEFRQLQAGTLLTIEIFKEAIDSRMSAVNLGPDNKGSGTFNYKSNFGARMQTVYCYQVEENCVKLILLRLLQFIKCKIISSPGLFSLIKRVIRT